MDRKAEYQEAYDFLRKNFPYDKEWGSVVHVHCLTWTTYGSGDDETFGVYGPMSNYPECIVADDMVYFGWKYSTDRRGCFLSTSMHEIERKKKELVRKWKSRKPCKAMARNQKGAKTYLIQNGTSSLYKIGQSVDVGKRFNEIKSHNPDAKLLHVSKTLHERDLHERYKTKRKFREWFELSPGDVHEITASE